MATETDPDATAPTATGNLPDRYRTTTLRARLAANPRPALVWAGVMALLLSVELGALLNFVTSFARDTAVALPVLPAEPFQAAVDATARIPTLLDRDVVPNRGHWNGERYVGTFLGLSPFRAWLLRVVMVYAYSLAVAGWCWVGYDWYREHYRGADWTPRDDVIDRLRGHYWGLFGLAIVFAFVVMAVFAPTLGPTTVQENMVNPYSYELQYYDAESGSVETTTIGSANRGSRSIGSRNVGPMSYDDYGRFHPFGTMPTGRDLFTFIVAGSRISLVLGLLTVGLSSSIAVTFGLASAYYKDRVDLSMVLLADAVMAMPQLLLVIMLSVVFGGTWLGELYSGGLILALFLAGTGWPYLWRSIRGPALQVAERNWIDAARSFGQRPTVIMRKHMLPYLVGYLLIYGSMTLGGVIIAIAGLSFLGLGISPPTPEWGRAVNLGQDYVSTASWHVSLIPGVLITLVVTGFNAFGDGVRDAIDPQSDSAAGEAGGRGGGA